MSSRVSPIFYFHTISSSAAGLDACRQEYEPLEALTLAQKQARRLVLEQPYEAGRITEAHWARMDDLLANPALVAELVTLNLKHFAAEGCATSGQGAPLRLATPEESPYRRRQNSAIGPAASRILAHYLPHAALGFALLAERRGGPGSCLRLAPGSPISSP